MREGEEEGAHRGVWGTGGARVGLGRARPGWVTSRIKTHNTHDHQTELNHEPKTETERDEDTTLDKEMCFGMMQHP
jgi:hypothetical protein